MEYADRYTAGECHAQTKQGPGEWWKLPSAALTWERPGSVLHSVAPRLHYLNKHMGRENGVPVIWTIYFLCVS